MSNQVTITPGQEKTVLCKEQPPKAAQTPTDTSLFAAQTDVIKAAQELEKAIHSKSKDDTLKYLCLVRYYLVCAQDHLEYNGGETLAADIQKITDELNKTIKEVETTSKTSKMNCLRGYNLMAFHGVLGGLYETLQE